MGVNEFWKREKLGQGTKMDTVTLAEREGDLRDNR